VPGLDPERWYFYRFMVGEHVSPVGRTLTLPRPEAQVQRLRLGYASCQKWEDGFFSAWRHLRAEQPDGVVFLGDYIYEYPGRSSRVRVPTGGWVVSLDELPPALCPVQKRPRPAGHARGLPLVGNLGRP